MKEDYKAVSRIVEIACQNGRLEEAVRVLNEYADARLLPLYEATGCKTIEGLTAWVKKREKETAY